MGIFIIYIISCLTISGGIITAAAGGHKPWDADRKLIFDRGLMFTFLNGIGMIFSSTPSFLGIYFIINIISWTIFIVFNWSSFILCSIIS